jgi:acyl dehydratase
VRPYLVIARNTSTDSDNKIHDNDVARRYGFDGGLVPGVVVHAYLTHPPAEQWGLDWLKGGSISARFRKPVYDGDKVTVDCEGETTLVARRPSGEVAAEAQVTAPGAAPDVDVSRWPHLPLPAKQDRPPASAEVLTAHRVLGALDVHFHGELADLYLEAIGETLPLYRDEGVAHPGWLIAQANYVLSANVVLGPWIHVQSDVTHFGVVRDGDVISTRAVVLGTSERRGHRFVDLDVLIVDGDERPVLRARHTAIYEPRSGS